MEHAESPGGLAVMNDAIFFGAFSICVPVGILLAVLFPRIHKAVFFCLVLGTTNTGGLFGLPLDINFLSREWYRGTTRGIEVSYLDLLAIILFVSTLIVRKREGRPMFFWPVSLGWMLAYFTFASLHTIAIADPKLFALFELTKTLRGIFIFVTVALYVRSMKDLELLIWAFCAAIGYEAFVCLRDRYVFHFHRIRGTLGHPNTLSLYMLIMVPFMITGALSRTNNALRIACCLGFLAAAGCVVLTISRTGFATLVLLSGSCGLIAMGLKVTVRNVTIVAVASLVFLGVLAKSWDTIESRMLINSYEDEFGEDSYGGRGMYIKYLELILADKPLGVGFNNWSYHVTNDYAAKLGVIYHPYVGTDYPPNIDPRGTVNTMGGSQTAPAHNIFFLTLGELGWPGIIFFCGMVAAWFYMSATYLPNRTESLVSRYGLAAFFALLAIFFQGLTEWVFRLTPIFIESHIVVGALAALYNGRDPRK